MNVTTSSTAALGAPTAAVIAENLRLALRGTSSAWILTALKQAECDPLAMAINAAALASALALRAAQFLEIEMRQREAEVLAGVPA
jgi:hypothetical protein